MAITDGGSVPVGVSVHSASPHESTLAAETVSECHTEELPGRLIGDKAYDCDQLDADLLENYGIELISPHRKNRKAENKTQDGRPLRRYKRRWKVERFFAWLQSFRRVRTRDEFHAENYLGFVQLGCIVILLRNIEKLF